MGPPDDPSPSSAQGSWVDATRVLTMHRERASLPDRCDRSRVLSQPGAGPILTPPRNGGHVVQRRNPHFDDGIVVWSDRYSGAYFPPGEDYGDQFELQWSVARSGLWDYANHPGACTGDDFIEDRIYEWTGEQSPARARRSLTDGSRPLDIPVPAEVVRGKKCIDLGCGMGRWTKTMMRMGAASVLSVDVSKSALAAVAQFNDNVRRANLMELQAECPDLARSYDLAVLGGVAHHTHDPAKASNPPHGRSGGRAGCTRWYIRRTGCMGGP